MSCGSFVSLDTGFNHSIKYVKQYAPRHIFWHEKLVVEAFYNYSGSGKIVVDIGANIGGLTMISLLLNSTVYAVEMQPACCELIRCNNFINGFQKLHILNGFVPQYSSLPHVPILIHPRMCNVMASSTATGGRWPHGLLMKSHRRMNWNETIPVKSLNLRELLSHHETISLTKIDTEGSEIETLLWLEWKKIQVVIIEFQAGAWHHNNISRHHGLSVVKRFIDFKAYSIFSLFGKTVRKWSSKELLEFLKYQKNNFREFLFLPQK